MKYLCYICLQTQRKGRVAHVTRYEQAGTANQDEKDGSAAYPQGDEHLPGGQAFAAHNLQCGDGQPPRTNERDLTAGEGIFEIGYSGHSIKGEVFGHQAGKEERRAAAPMNGIANQGTPFAKGQPTAALPRRPGFRDPLELRMLLWFNELKFLKSAG